MLFNKSLMIQQIEGSWFFTKKKKIQAMLLFFYNISGLKLYSM